MCECVCLEQKIEVAAEVNGMSNKGKMAKSCVDVGSNVPLLLGAQTISWLRSCMLRQFCLRAWSQIRKKMDDGWIKLYVRPLVCVS